VGEPSTFSSAIVQLIKNHKQYLQSKFRYIEGVIPVFSFSLAKKITIITKELKVHHQQPLCAQNCIV
jgi:hypothetical protein